MKNMQRMTIRDILNATGGTLLSGSEDTEINQIITDTRKLTDGSLFIPLVGEKFDGHEFIKAAFDMGAAAVLTHNDTELLIDKTIIKVEDTLKALRDITAYYKKKYPLPTVAVTGSVGKTTTKDMLYAALSEKYNTLKTPNNFNNEIGVPITVFMLEKEHECAVIEMGMNHFGEIERLAEMGQPNVAVITNIGMSHIENLGSQEGIFKAKMEITKRFTKDNTLIVNGDDKFLSTTKGMGEYKVVYYGIDNPENDVYAKDIVNNGLKGIEFTAVVDGKEYHVEVTQPGKHNVYNALAAICVGREFGVEIEDSIRGIKNCEYTSQRLEVDEFGGMQIINDCYNASPDSIRAALSVLKCATVPRKIAILGDVLEMGEFARDAHYALGKAVVESNVDMLITAGENAEYIARGAKDCGMENVVSFPKTLDVCNYVKDVLHEGDAVLIKASHGMHFEDIYNTIKTKESL
jgi:UDP-N-acetylmuramoyl-tripeptide--D-alanyl-D-alanine ligase